MQEMNVSDTDKEYKILNAYLKSVKIKKTELILSLIQILATFSMIFALFALLYYTKFSDLPELYFLWGLYPVITLFFLIGISYGYSNYMNSWPWTMARILRVIVLLGVLVLCIYLGIQEIWLNCYEAKQVYCYDKKYKTLTWPYWMWSISQWVLLVFTVISFIFCDMFLSAYREVMLSHPNSAALISKLLKNRTYYEKSGWSFLASPVNNETKYFISKRQQLH